MIDKKKLLDELREKFSEVKKEIGFKSEFEELNNEFFLADSVFSVGFVSDNLLRQLSHRITDTFSSWSTYLHSLIMPNPGNFLNQTESKFFNSQEDKNKIWNILREIMYFSSLNSISILSKDKSKDREFIDGSLDFWKSRLKPQILEILYKVNSGWGESKN